MRRAVADAIDYNGHRRRRSRARPSQVGHHPAGADRGYSPSLGFKQDTSKAKALLARPATGGGKKLSLTLTLANGDADEALTASIIKSDLSAVGVDMTVKAL